MSNDPLGTLAERAARGSLECDRAFGPKWHRKVSAFLLDMRSVHRCVLGQIASDYYLGIWDIRPDEEGCDWSVRHGFILPAGATPGEYEELTKAWQLEICKRMGFVGRIFSLLYK